MRIVVKPRRVLPRVLCADPPWSFDDKLPGETRGAASQYDVLGLDGICNFQIPEMADESWLFLWRVSAMVEEAYKVVRAWGFVPKSEIVWEKLTVNGKPHFGMGRYVRASHETAIVAVRGKPKPLDLSVRSRFAATVGKHSQKPEEFYNIVERLSGGPYVELFGRRPRAGWTVCGNEIDGGTISLPR